MPNKALKKYALDEKKKQQLKDHFSPPGRQVLHDLKRYYSTMRLHASGDVHVVADPSMLRGELSGFRDAIRVADVSIWRPESMGDLHASRERPDLDANERDDGEEPPRRPGSIESIAAAAFDVVLIDDFASVAELALEALDKGDTAKAATVLREALRSGLDDIVTGEPD